MAVIDLYDRYLGRGKRMGTGWAAYDCFNCQHKLDLCVNMNSGGYYCHCCGISGSISTFARMVGESPNGFLLDCSGRIEVKPQPPQSLLSHIYAGLFGEVGDLPRVDWIERREYTGYLTRVTGDVRLLPQVKGPLINRMLDQYGYDSCHSAGLCYIKDREVRVGSAIAFGRILVPYLGNDEVEYFRGYAGGRDPKYSSPFGIRAKTRVYGSLVPGKAAIITEGEFKALAARILGFNCIGIPGMRASREALANKCLEAQTPRAFIIFDSQWKSSHHVESAIENLKTSLQNAGIPTCNVVLPLDPTEEKMDLDLYLDREGPDALRSLIKNAWKERE